MFLIRAAFWLTVVVFLLPADPQSGSQSPGVGALQAIDAVSATASDVSGFCGRNPDVCVTASTAGEIFSEKLRYGMRLLQGAFGSHDDAAPSADTLTSADLAAPWHGAKRNGA
jgi:hypothetical protein